MSYESAPGMPAEGHGAPPPAAAKPGSVSLAEKLMYGGAAVTLISGLLGLFGDQDAMREAMRQTQEDLGQPTDEASLDAVMQLTMITGIVAAVVGAALWALMGWLNGKGIGWARIVATVLGILGVLVTIAGLVGTAILPGTVETGGALSMVLSIVVGLLALAVVVLLWRPDASAFFAARKRR